MWKAIGLLLLLIGLAGASYAATVFISGDCTQANSGALTCLYTNGVPFAASATTDTTNAANITSGTLPNARIPTPTAIALGGVESLTAIPNNFVTGLGSNGILTYAPLPTFSQVATTLVLRRIGGL